MVVSDLGPFWEIAPWFIPQLQFEIHCLGPQCQSAVFVSQSATRGAVILRIHRDDAYIDLMLSELRWFYSAFVVTRTEPHVDFGVLRPQRQALLDKTLELASSAELVTAIDHKDIQRSPGGELLVPP
mmetsp:Transcript_8112/g.19426  ORF Transcript_8112/g.19426 Transcript_8112/m.19426 type:complete len:127 (+) Transcript_8112:363-743(+)